jgi:argininosuccinate lyase
LHDSVIWDLSLKPGPVGRTTDTRLWTVEAERKLLKDMKTLLLAGAEAAKEHVDILMAGYTHHGCAVIFKKYIQLFSTWVTLINNYINEISILLPKVDPPVGSHSKKI